MKKYIFIRSYHKDLGWLKYCLRSIQKFVTGHDGVVVTVPSQDVELFKSHNIDVVGCPDYKPGYLAQQATKIYADLFIKGIAPEDWIIYVDSDCVFTAPFHVEQLFNADGAPYALYTPYEHVGEAICWKKPTEAALGFSCPYEQMRRHGAVYSCQELKKFRMWFSALHNQSVDSYIRKVNPQVNFSEFNVLGSWLMHLQRDSREWRQVGNGAGHGNPVGDAPPLPLQQGWSWGGVDKHIAEFEKILA